MKPLQTLHPYPMPFVTRSISPSLSSQCPMPRHNEKQFSMVQQRRKRLRQQRRAGPFSCRMSPHRLQFQRKAERQRIKVPHLLIATLILSATRAAIALNHNNDYSVSPDSKIWRLEKRRSLQKDSLIASFLDHNDYSVIADRREIIQSNKIKSRSVPSESPQLSLDQESITNEQSYHRNELVVPTFTSTDVSSELDIPTFSILLESSVSSSSINEEMKDEITRGTREYLENILEGSSFASDGMGAFEGIEVTLESIKDVEAQALARDNKARGTNGNRERKRRTLGRVDRNDFNVNDNDHLHQQDTLGWKRRTLQYTARSDDQNSVQNMDKSQVAAMFHEERMAAEPPLPAGSSSKNTTLSSPLRVAASHHEQVPPNPESRFLLSVPQQSQQKKNRSYQHSTHPQSRQLRQRHHQPPLSVPKTTSYTNYATDSQGRSNDPVEVALTFSAVAKFAQPVDGAITNGDGLFSYVSKALEKEEAVGVEEIGVGIVGNEDRNNTSSGYLESMKKRFQNMDDEGANETLAFWENVSGLSVTKVGNEGSDALLPPGIIDASNPLPGAEPSLPPNVVIATENDEITDDASPALPPSSGTKPFDPPSFPAAPTSSNETLGEGEEIINNETENITLIDNSTGTTNTTGTDNSSNSVNGSANNNNSSDSDLGAPVPPPTPKGDDLDNKQKRKQTTSIILGASAGAVAVVLIVVFSLYRRWERNIDRRVDSDRALTLDHPPAPSPPSSPNSSKSGLLNKNSSSGSSSLMIAGGVKQSTFEDHDEDDAEGRRLKSSMRDEDTEGWTKNISLSPLRTSKKGNSTLASDPFLSPESTSSSADAPIKTPPAWLSSQSPTSPWWENTKKEDEDSSETSKSLVHPVKSRVVNWDPDHEIDHTTRTAGSRRQMRQEEDDFLHDIGADPSFSLVFPEPERALQPSKSSSSSGSGGSRRLIAGKLGSWRPVANKSASSMPSSSSSSGNGRKALLKENRDDKFGENGLAEKLRMFFGRPSVNDKSSRATGKAGGEKDDSNEERQGNDAYVSKHEEGADRMDCIEEGLNGSLGGLVAEGLLLPLDEMSEDEDDEEGETLVLKCKDANKAGNLMSTLSNPNDTTAATNESIRRSLIYLKQHDKRPGMDVDNRSDLESEEEWHRGMPSLPYHFDPRDESVYSGSVHSHGNSDKDSFQQQNNGIIWKITPKDKSLEDVSAGTGSERHLPTLKEGENTENRSRQPLMDNSSLSHCEISSGSVSHSGKDSSSSNPSDFSGRLSLPRLVGEEPAVPVAASHLSRHSSGNTSFSSSSKSTKLEKLHAVIDEMYCDLSAKTSAKYPPQKISVSEDNVEDDIINKQAVLAADRRAQREQEESLLYEHSRSILGMTSTMEGTNNEEKMTTILDDLNDEEMEDEAMEMMMRVRQRMAEDSEEKENVDRNNSLDSYWS